MLVVVLTGAVSVPLVFHALRKRGGPRPLDDDVSLRRAVACLADSYLPSIPEKAEAARNAGNDDLVAYYLTSGGQSEELQRLVLKAVDAQLSPRNRFELVLLLRLLSSRWGSLLLTRTACMTRKWPFVHAFTDLPLRRRQDILRRWSLHWLPQMRKAFKGTKALILAVALANGPDNLLWRGMGFPGTDPARPEVPLASSLQEEAGVAAAVVDVVEERAKNSFCKPLDLLAGRGLRIRAAGDADRKLAGEADLAGVLECDAVVVGSGGGGGTAGGVLAAAGMRVVVLEKSSFKRIAAMSGIERSAFRDMYECAGLFSTPDSAISILAGTPSYIRDHHPGSTLGGGTRINWCASFRTPDHVRQEWASKHGLPNFTSERYSRALDAVCQRLGVHQDVTYNRQNSLLIQGLNRTGLHSGPIPQNCRSPDSCSMHCGLGCAYGGKMDTVRTFLSDAAQHGAKILTQANARRIITRRAHSSGTVSGTRRREVAGVLVECVGTDEAHDNGPRAPAAKLLVRAKIVVSSGGSLHTPALLLRSGIRGGGQVGAHLHLHPATVLAASFPQEHTVAGTEVVQKSWQGPIMTAFSRASADWEGGGYGPMVALPAASPGLVGACLSWEGGEELKEDLLEYPGLVFPLVYVRDRGEGRITIDSRGEPVAQYWPCAFDRQSMREGLVLAAKAMGAAGASRLFTLHNAPLRYEVDEQHSEERFAAWLKQLRAADFKPNTMMVASAHQMGSCRMGSCASNSAVDGEGHSWEVDGLYVADASTFPTASGVNPMITVQAIGYMVAEGIAARYPIASKMKGRL